MKFRLREKLSRQKILIIWTVFAALCVFACVLASSFSFVDVNDNGVVKRYFTWNKDVNEFLDESGIVLYQGDVINAPERLTTFSDVEIQRSFEVVVNHGLETTTLRSVRANVGDILTKNNITYDADDLLNHQADALIEGPTTITLDYIDKVIVKEEEGVPSSTQFVKAADLPNGRQTQMQAGSDGLKVASYEVIYKNGQEVDKVLLSKEVTVEPVARIVKVGTKSATLTSRSESLRYKRVIDVKAYAYCMGTRTATGTRPRVGTVAVDPRVIPLGSRLYIEGANGQWHYGYAVAEDTGGSIKGNKIDLYMNTKAECIDFGIRAARVYILE